MGAAMSALEIRSNGHIFIAGTKGSAAANSPFEARAILKEAGFWWHGGPCKPGCKACEFKVPKMWWTAEPARAARLKAFCDPKALAALAPIFAQLEKSHQTDAEIDLPCPEGLAYDGFQKAGVAFALEAFKSFRGALIADEMGLGKTVQALGVMNAMVAQLPDSLRCAVVCPKSLVLNWKGEAEKWLGPKWQVATYEEECDWSNPYVLFITSYSQVSKFPKVFDVEDAEFDLLVFDESQYIKNPDAARTRECIDHVEVNIHNKREVVKGRIQSQARHTLFLSGTPLLNRPLELQTILIALDSSFQGFWFLKKFCDAKKNGQGHWDFSGASNLEELQNIMRSKFMVRRLKKDVYKDLPPKRRSLIPLALNSEAKAIIKAAGTEPSFESSVANMESKKPWGHPAQVRQQLAIAKVDKVVEFVKDLLENTQKVIVFGFTINALRRIHSELADFSSMLIIGDTPMVERQDYVERFQSDPKARVIVGGYGPMGVGLTLTASSAVVMSEPAWTPAEVSQAEDRAHRRGQTDMVNCYHLVWDGTLEAKMMKMIVAKQDIADRVLDKNTEITAPMGEIVNVRAGGTTTAVFKPHQPTFAFTPEEKALILRALKHLAARCDGAVGVDGQGFNKLDSAFGKSLSHEIHLTDKQAHFGKKLIKKYRSQLEAAEISLAALEGI